MIGIVLAVPLAVFRVRTLRMQGTHDLRRIRDLYHIQIALTLFYDKSAERRYPLYNPGACQDIRVLVESLVPNFIPHLPEDPRVSSGHPNYQFGVAEDGQRFVLRARLKTPHHPHLASSYDLDGTIFGCECNDSFYCVSL
ncbi:MAG: hypothetical protein G01um101466_101 [Parcubacteria group bacterium Gr01-1014_66]|nr:MAG: hypothetical protein G01um101466_101 [Parcubacteria group bacterium Gr01-1014_66]